MRWMILEIFFGLIFDKLVGFRVFIFLNGSFIVEFIVLVVLDILIVGYEYNYILFGVFSY